MGQPRRRPGRRLHGPRDAARPQPRVVTPGTASTQEKAGLPPSDATVLFDGRSLGGWVTAKGAPAAWTLGEGWMEVKPGTGSIRTPGRTRLPDVP